MHRALCVRAQAQSIRFVDMLSSIFDFSHSPEKMHEKVLLACRLPTSPLSLSIPCPRTLPQLREILRPNASSRGVLTLTMGDRSARPRRNTRVERVHSPTPFPHTPRASNPSL